MRKAVNLVAILGLTAAIAACSGRTEEQQDVVYVPVEPEPVTTKY
ncbi:hypothetical protein [uncultured Jannaschia sp.]|nr:hypothetical protein [uncultured Jannaschia sp.]